MRRLPTLARWMALPALLAVAGLAAACGAKPAAPAPPTVPLQSATLKQLVDAFNHNADAVQTMSLKLDLTATAGKHKYTTISGYLLMQKPDSLRIWGTFTLVGRLFDMASQDGHFDLIIPTHNEFIEGSNDIIPKDVKNPLEKLRPQVILDSLLSYPIGPESRVAFDPAESPTDYDVLVLQTGSDNVDRLMRRITFSRYDLLPVRQVLYDRDGTPTISTYSRYTVLDQIPVPTLMTIDRPVEGYTLKLQINARGSVLNKPFTIPGTFTLTPPAGYTVVKLTANGARPASQH